MVSPREDFYLHVNSKWLKDHPMPASESRWGTFDVLIDTTMRQLKAICEDTQGVVDAPKGSNAQIIRDFYRSGMDMDRRDREGVAPVQGLLAEIDNLSSAKDAAFALGKLMKKGISPFFDAGVDKDVKNPDMAVLYLSQGGLGMPDRDYYLEDTEEMDKTREAYKAYMVRIFLLSGYSLQRAEEAAKAVYDIEYKLAQVSRPKEVVREVEKNYNKYSVRKANKDFAVLRNGYLKAAGGSHLRNLVVMQPEFLKGVDDVLDGDLGAVKEYMKWNVLNESAGFLSSDFGNARFDFYSKTLQGLKEQQPLWKRVVRAMQGRYGTPLTEALGPLYVERHFSSEAKDMLYQMVEDVRDAFKDRVASLDWMDKDTKKLVYKKVDKITFKMGYPDKWVDVSSIGVDDLSYVENQQKVREFEFNRKMKEAGGPADWSEWVMNPTIVNACADQMREMTYPAAILQDVFFDPEKDMAYNYGSFASIIGHELTHFVDDQGSKFNADGKLEDWWPQSVKDGFEAGSKAFVTHYNKYSVQGVPINGEFTQGENIGDVAGLTIGLEAYKRYQARTGDNAVKDGLTPEQRYFVGYARTECEHKTLERVKLASKTDPHSPSEVRVNAALAIIPEFVEAFDIKPGDKMYVDPATYPKLW